MIKFVRVAAAVLALLLLTACAAVPQQTEAPKTPEQILSERRDIAEEKMRWALSFLWRAEEDITYSRNAKSMGPDADPEGDLIQIKKGRVYRGLPYAHSSGSVYSFISFGSQDDKGVYNISGMTTKMLNGYPNDSGFNIARISSDCADTIYWAWSHVSTSIFFDLTNRMTEMAGCLKVGEYAFEGTSYKNTIETCKENGEQTMFAAYAQMQKADAVVKVPASGSGHAMMVVEVHVEKNGQTIDPELSYVVIHDQVSSNLQAEKYEYNEQLQENVYLGGRLDVKVTFGRLFELGYLPVTCKEFIDPSPLPEETVTDNEKEHTKDTIFKGVFQSPYRISSVTITITDKDGKVVQQMTGFGKQEEMMRFRLPRMIDEAEADVVRGSIDLDALAAGTYKCTHTCQIATGKILTVRDFEFTV